MASILMVAGEGLPFIKTGGLADVIGSLPQALTERGHEVKVVMPLYKKISDKYYNELHFDCEYSVSINASFPILQERPTIEFLTTPLISQPFEINEPVAVPPFK